MSEPLFQKIASDYTFKRVFASQHHKHYLISILNHFLESYIGRIEDVEYLPTEHYGAIAEHKRIFFDIMCRDDRNRNFIIEMQHARQPEYVDRSILYCSRAISDSVERGANSYQIIPTYSFNLLDFELPEYAKSDKCFHAVFLKNQNNELLTTKVGYFYVFLRNFAAEQKGVTREMKTWMELIFNSDNLRECDYDRMDSLFKGLLDECRISKLDKMEKEKYYKSVLEYEDVQDAIAYAKEYAAKEGFAEGMEKGLEKGLELLRNTAMKFLKMGLPITDVAEATGLGIEELKKLSE